MIGIFLLAAIFGNTSGKSGLKDGSEGGGIVGFEPDNTFYEMFW